MKYQEGEGKKERDDFRDLQEIVSKESLRHGQERICRLQMIVESCERDIIQMLENSFRVYVENEEKLQLEVQEKLQSFMTAIKNLYRIFSKLLKQQAYIGLMTQGTVRTLCQTLSSKVESHWVQFSRSTSKLKNPNHYNPTDELPTQRGRLSRKNEKISLKANCTLQKWLLQNFSHPYPCNQVKSRLAKKAELNIHQVNNWFTNARQRGLKKLRKTRSERQESGSEDN